MKNPKIIDDRSCATSLTWPNLLLFSPISSARFIAVSLIKVVIFKGNNFELN